MSKEKQIEEMGKIITKAYYNKHCWKIACQNCKYYELDADVCQNCLAAEAIYNAGYRKQNENVTDINVGSKSEWISVEERLPEPNVDCLVAAKVGNRMVVDLGSREWCFDYRTMEQSYVWSIMNDWDEGEGCEITHWMPLPEAPKMRKEDEGK
jgi:hypothetical protein